MSRHQEESGFIPWWAASVAMAALYPIAMWCAVVALPASWTPETNFGLAIGITAVFLSVVGAALHPRSPAKIAMIAFLLAVIAPFIVWLFTSSIGGQSPGPLGLVLGAVGSCIAFLTSRLTNRILVPVLVAIPVFAFGAYGSVVKTRSANARNMNAESASPTYVAANVLPDLIVDPPRVSWMDLKYGPGHEETGGEFIARGNFVKAGGGIYVRAFADTAHYTIMMDTTSTYKATDLRGDVEWLRNQHVRVDKLTNIARTQDGWTADGPRDLKGIVISRIRNQLVIGGNVDLPPFK